MRSLWVIIFLSFSFLVPVTSFAQDVSEADTVDMGFLMRREKSWNLMLHTLGYGVGYRFGVNQTYYKNRMFEFDLFEMRAPNQAKRYNENYQNPRSYVYGKLNNLYILRAGIGRQHLINRKPYWGGVEVRAFYYGGIDIGLAKPSYLYIDYYNIDTLNNRITVLGRPLERYDPNKHFPGIGTNPDTLSDIFGRGPLLSGFNKIKPYPGFYAKGGFNFEFSEQNDRIKSLEIGASIDVFPIPVPVMAFREKNYYFVTGYISFHFGKRYN
ncbi:MAG: hypothetical protein ACOYN4_02095 [Bacteroidales bacterium]